MKIIITESQYKNLVDNDIPISLKRRFESIKLMIPSIIKYYDVDEYNKIDFIDEVLHQIYDEIDYRDINSFFDHIKPLLNDYIGNIYDKKTNLRLKRKK
jgi:hypothetical protein